MSARTAAAKVARAEGRGPKVADERAVTPDGAAHVG